jgi:hypothetical protein
MFVYSYCYVRSVLGILFHCVVLCICVTMCTVLLPLGVNPIAVNKYIIPIMPSGRDVLPRLLIAEDRAKRRSLTNETSADLY